MKLVASLFTIGVVGLLYLAYAMITIQIHLHLFSTTLTVMAVIFLAAAAVVSRLGYNLYKFMRKGQL